MDINSSQDTHVEYHFSDYFKWYMQEIIRYRDREWQLVALSVGLTTTLLIFAMKDCPKYHICPIIIPDLILILVIMLAVVEYHTHSKLNEYRLRFDLLRNGKDHRFRIKPIGYKLIADAIDGFYFIGFLSLPVIYGVFAHFYILIDMMIW